MDSSDYKYNTDLETKQFLNGLFQSDSIKKKHSTMRKCRDNIKPIVQYVESSESEEDPFAGDSFDDEYVPTNNHDDETESDVSDSSASTSIKGGKRKVCNQETYITLKYDTIGELFISVI